jgi:poly(3-hydroxybutyrate) depolymerase
MKLFFYIFLIFAPLINSMERITISHAGEERSYLLFIPTVQKESYKLVIGLHGFSGSASGFEKETTGGFNLYAEEQGLIVVYPQGNYFYPSYQTTDPKAH